MAYSNSIKQIGGTCCHEKSKFLLVSLLKKMTQSKSKLPTKVDYYYSLIEEAATLKTRNSQLMNNIARLEDELEEMKAKMEKEKKEMKVKMEKEKEEMQKEKKEKEAKIEKELKEMEVKMEKEKEEMQKEKKEMEAKMEKEKKIGKEEIEALKQEFAGQVGIIASLTVTTGKKRPFIANEDEDNQPSKYPKFDAILPGNPSPENLSLLPS